MSLLRIYIWVICILTIVYLVFYKHERNVIKTLLQQTDMLLFTYNKAILDHQKTIYDFDTTKTLLFHNQNSFFAQWKKYTDLTIPLLKDIEYLQTLIQTTFISESVVKIVKATYITWQKLHILKEYTHIILIILTLWIAKLLLP